MKIAQSLFSILLLLVALTACECSFDAGGAKNAPQPVSSTGPAPSPSSDSPKNAGAGSSTSSSPGPAFPGNSPSGPREGQSKLGRLLGAELGAGCRGGHGEDYEIVNPKTVFSTTAPEVVCVWAVVDGQVGAQLKSVWIAEDVGGVAPPNYQIDQRTFELEEPEMTGYFNLTSPDNGFPKGKYRLEIYLGSDLVKVLPFQVE